MATKRVTEHRDTLPPTGLSIKRDGRNMVCSWKIHDKDYGDGQWFEYSISWDSLGWSDWIAVNIGETTQKKTIQIVLSRWRPSTSNELNGFRFRVRGKRKDYTTDKTKGDDTIRTTWKSKTSSWETKSFDVLVPSTPKVPKATLTNVVNSTRFTWETSASETSSRWFRRIEWQSMRVKNSIESDGAKAGTWKETANNDWKEGNSTSVTGGTTITEQSEVTNATKNSYTRWFRVRAVGVQGATEWRYVRHVYAVPLQAQNVTATATGKANGSTEVFVKWSSAITYLQNKEKKIKSLHPIDQTTVEYKIAQPLAGMECPSGNWSTGGVLKDTTDQDGLRFSIDDQIDLDEVIFVRVNNEHDRNGEYGITRGEPLIPKGAIGVLKPPKLNGFEPDPQSQRVLVDFENQSDVPDSRVALYARVPYAPQQRLLLAVGTTQTQTSFIVPYDDLPEYQSGVVLQMGLQAIVGTIKRSSTVAIEDVIMQSAFVGDSGTLPSPPTNVVGTATISDGIGTISVKWDWSWDKADGAILSWSDHRDAWMSTDEPEEYEVSQLHQSQWNISGLEAGKVWYVRVRFYRETGEGRVLSPWSELTDDSIVKVKSAPSIPTMVLDRDTITEDETVEASWAYSTADGASQSQAQICLATINGSDITYSEPIVTVGTAQHVLLDANALGFTNGNQYNLCVKVTSASGETSAEWSTPVTLNVAEKPTVEITGMTSFRDDTIDDGVSFVADPVIDGLGVDADVMRTALGEIPTQIVFTRDSDAWDVAYSGTGQTVLDLSEIGVYADIPDDLNGFILTEIELLSHQTKTLFRLPFTVTAIGAGKGGKTTLSVTRKNDYRLERPDETTYSGFKGENIVTVEQTGESPISVDLNNLVGTLDDGETYVLKVTVTDSYGQSVDSDDIEFEVHWDIQAKEPHANIEVRGNVVLITPKAPEDADDGDYIEIYRLSADKPELIVPKAQFNTTYVDPYPAIGAHGGHRLVYKTKYGDFIYTDEDGEKPAITNLNEENGDYIESDYALIDYNGVQIPLYYNVQVSNQWQKDFRVTRYLGGSDAGDWNDGVSRTASVSAVKINLTDEQDVINLKRLGEHLGACHLRTLDGSSITCDIQVSEDRPSEKRNMVTSFSMAVTRIDGSGYDGMTLKDYEEMYGME